MKFIKNIKEQFNNFIKKEVVSVAKEEKKQAEPKVSDRIADIWARAGNNEPLSTEEFALYEQEVARRRSKKSK